MKPLLSRLVDVLFAGLDLKTNEKLALPGKLLVLENGSFTEGGTIKKRNGYSALARDVLSGVALTAGKALGRFNDELLLFNGGQAYSYASGLAQWISKGAVPPVTAAAEPIVRNTYQQSNPDAATTGTMTVYAWADTRGGIRATVVDEETGNAILSDVSISATGARPRCLAVGTALFVLFYDSTNIKARRLDTTSPTAFAAETTLRVDGNGTAGEQHLDADAVDDDAGLFVYNGGAAANTTVLAYLLADGSVGAPTNGYPAPVTIAEASDKSVTVEYGADNADRAVMVAFSNAAAVRAVTFIGADLSPLGAIDDVEAIGNCENITALYEDDSFTVYYEVQAAATYNRLVRYARFDVSMSQELAPTLLMRSVGLGGKAFAYGSGPAIGDSHRVIVVHDSTLQATYFVVQEDDLAIEARLLANNAGGIQSGQIPSVLTFAPTEFAFPASHKTKAIFEGNTVNSLIGVTKSSVTFEAETAYRSGQLGQNLIAAGAVVTTYDGQSFVEAGFFLFPHDVSSVVAAGGALEAGTRQARFVWAWEDAKGQTHRSAPSVAVSFTAALNDKVTFTVPTLRITMKKSPRTNVRLECYTTEAAGTVFYKTPDAAGSAIANPVYNDPTADTITFVRAVADTAILANEILYTQGGVLENIAPPAASLIAVGKLRCFLAGMEDPFAYAYTKESVLAEGVEFTDLFVRRLDPEGGPITALGMLDDKAVFFKESSIHVVAGDGPAANGSNDSFTAEILVTTDVGCTNPASVAITPDGLVFETAKGLYRLTRGLKAEYVGAAVERKVAEVAIRSALLDDSKNQVRVLTDGEALVFDYFFNEWATWTNHVGVDQVIFDGAYHYLREDGTVYRETPGVFLDDTLAIRLRLKTAWIKLGESIQGFQRIWRALFLGDFYTSHDMRVRVAFDYQPFWIEEHTWDADVVTDGDDYGSGDYGEGPYSASAAGDLVYQFEVNNREQLCEAIQFEIEDVGSTSGQAYSLSMLTLEVGVEKGPFRLPEGKRVA